MIFTYSKQSIWGSESSHWESTGHSYIELDLALFILSLRPVGLVRFWTLFRQEGEEGGRRKNTAMKRRWNVVRCQLLEKTLNYTGYIKCKGYYVKKE